MSQAERDIRKSCDASAYLCCVKSDYWVRSVTVNWWTSYRFRKAYSAFLFISIQLLNNQILNHPVITYRCLICSDFQKNDQSMQIYTLTYSLKSQCLVYVPQVSTLNNSAFCPHSAFMCFVWILEQRVIISLYSIHWLVFITDKEYVYSAVRSEHLNASPIKH